MTKGRPRSGTRHYPAPHKISLQFMAARSAFKNIYKNASEASAHERIKHRLGRTRVFEIYADDVPDGYFSPKIQEIIISLTRNPQDDSVFTWISSKINFNMHDTKYNYNKYLGDYRYWRSFPQELNPKKMEIRVGIVNLSLENGYLKYKHRSANAINATGWEDEGFAFIVNEKIYMIGLRESNIRLAIARISGSIDKNPLQGMVLSTRQKNGDIFSACFVLFHESNRKHFERTSVSIDEFQSTCTNQPDEEYRIMIE